MMEATGERASDPQSPFHQVVDEMFGTTAILHLHPKDLLESVLRQTAKNLALIQDKVAKYGSDDTIGLVDLCTRQQLQLQVSWDNTYVSNSEYEDEVLVTRDQIPVIFHRIATEIRVNNDANCCLSIKSKHQIDKNQCHYAIEEDSEGDADSEEFYYGGQVNSDGELHKHPQLEVDLAAVREMYGHHAVSLREYGAIDDVDIDLHIDVSFLD
ncbi:protein mono-ADP-ribosyltransferase PARP8-like, partial [Oncorhynchus clarkii lewisi]|uniref:protein mono-ADP-ribosyltransferase PARP8-like n=1 Tax=Oncorhynchus clarkii lewisi TaxID=490388 RepID=UPI0039B83666